MKRTGKYISVCLCVVMIATMFLCGDCAGRSLWNYPGTQSVLYVHFSWKIL